MSDDLYDDLSLEVNDLLGDAWAASGGKYPTGMLDLLWRVDMDRVRVRDLLANELKKPITADRPLPPTPDASWL